jgi:hypothetical protein
MPNSSINNLLTTTSSPNVIIPIQDVVGASEVRKTSVRDLQSVVLRETPTTVTLQGTDSTTTARLVYNINIISTSSATSSDYCARLPLNIQLGRTISVINFSGVVVRIFPSSIGGKINGVVDGYLDIPSNNSIYTFTCYEN